MSLGAGADRNTATQEQRQENRRMASEPAEQDDMAVLGYQPRARVQVAPTDASVSTAGRGENGRTEAAATPTPDDATAAHAHR